MAVITTRHAGRCTRCGRAVAVGERVEWARSTGVWCLPACESRLPSPGALASRASVPFAAPPIHTTYEPAPDPVPPEGWPSPGVAGASAMREYESQAAAEKVARRRSWPRRLPAALGLVLLSLPAAVLLEPAALAMGLITGGLVVLAPMWSPASSDALKYRTGAVGEQAVAVRLHELVDRKRTLGQAAGVLHDRVLPRRSENVDHILVTAAGVTVVEAKNWGGRLRLYQGRYYAGRRSSLDKAAQQARRQATAVRGALSKAGMTDVPVHAVVCLVGQARPRTALHVGDVTVTAADMLWTAIPVGAQVPDAQVARVAWVLDDRLRPA